MVRAPVLDVRGHRVNPCTGSIPVKRKWFISPVLVQYTIYAKLPEKKEHNLPSITSHFFFPDINLYFSHLLQYLCNPSAQYLHSVPHYLSALGRYRYVEWMPCTKNLLAQDSNPSAWGRIHNHSKFCNQT